jgi:hypothetical protein
MEEVGRLCQYKKLRESERCSVSDISTARVMDAGVLLCWPAQSCGSIGWGGMLASATDRTWLRSNFLKNTHSLSLFCVDKHQEGIY